MTIAKKLKDRIQRKNEAFDTFYGKICTLEAKISAYRTEVAYTLTKLQIILAREHK